MVDARPLWIWMAWAGLCVAAMAATPGRETIPYHLGYAGLGLAAGFGAWSSGRAVLALGGYTVASGAVLVHRASAGTIAWEETAEIPLMCLLVGLALWHIEKRDEAIARASVFIEREQAQMAHRERLVRIVSHEMRTPLAIASGYVDLMSGQHLSAQSRDDLTVVGEELDRSAMAVNRLLRLIRSHDELPLLDLDLDALLRDLVERWRVVADRDWRVEAAAGVQEVNADRARACVDTLVENAVRYTSPSEKVRVFAWAEKEHYVVGVADSGPGFNEAQIAAINSLPTDKVDASIIHDARSQTGLGISLVRETVESRGGRLEAGRAREGGAEVRMVFPRTT